MGSPEGENVPGIQRMFVVLFFASCVDIDECNTQSPCHASALCTNTLGSFTCACNPGYSGNGVTCNGECIGNS